MFVETGFYYALFDSTVALIHEFNAELVLLSKIKDTLASNEPFPLRRLEQARGYEGVAAVYPIYMERTNSLWRNTDPEDRRSRPIRVLAFNLEDPAWLLPEIEQHREALKLPDTALIDVKSKEFYGAREEGVVTELAQRRLEAVREKEEGETGAERREGKRREAEGEDAPSAETVKDPALGGHVDISG